MPTEWINIVDTAVKIGLGALISGVATYHITGLNHNNQHDQEKRKRRNDHFDQIITNADEYFHAFFRVVSLVDGISKQYDDINELDSGNPRHVKIFKELRARDIKFSEANNHHAYAASRLRLLDLSTALIALADFNRIVEEVRTEVFFIRRIPESEVIKDWKIALKKSVSDFYDAVRQEYGLET